MHTAKRDLEMLRRALYEKIYDERGLYRMSRVISYGRDELRVQVRSANGEKLADANAYTLETFGLISGKPHWLEFTSIDMRDIIALHIHLSYAAAYRNTTPWEARKTQKSFVFKDERVVLPFYKEDECTWIGYPKDDKVILQHPASYYGDLYLNWRKEVCGLWDEFDRLAKGEPAAAEMEDDQWKPGAPQASP